MSIKRRLLFLCTVVTLIVILCIGYVFLFAGDYHVSRQIYGDYTVNDAKIEISDESIIEIRDISLDENHNFTFTVHGLKKGKATIYIIFPYIEDSYVSDMIYLKCYVTSQGTVFRTDDFDFTGGMFVAYMIILCILLADIVMIWCYRTLRKQADYSYSMVVYRGIGMFLFVHSILILLSLSAYGYINFSAFVKTLCSLGGQFSFVMTPIALIVGIAVSISNIVLIKREGFGFVNCLGIMASVLIIGISIFRILGSDVSGSENEIAFLSAFEIAVDYVTTYFECMLLVTILCAYSATRYKPPFDRDYIAILGCAIRKDGTPTPILKARIDSAIEFEKKQFEKTGKHAFFVTSGGQGSDEVISESECMKRYLMEQGIPEERILKEDKSVNTFQNIKFSKKVIGEHCKEGDYKAAFATTNYHVFRGYILSKKNDFNAKGISAKTKWYFFPNAFLREFVGLLADKYKVHIAAVILLDVFYIGIYLLAFYH